MAESGWSTSAVVAGMALAIGVGLVVGYGIKNGDSTLGDEPPIRVKNGSMEFLVASGKWDEDACPGNPGRPCAWRPSDGEGRSTFTVVVDSTTACAVPADTTVDRIAVVYSDNKRFTLKPGNRQGGGQLATMVRPPALLKPDPQNPKALRYDAEGFVARIDFDGDDANGNTANWSCTFTNAQDLKQACFSASAAGCVP